MQPGNDSLTVTTAQASITIRDVNDSPPSFDEKNYDVLLPENTPPGTPLPIHINVRDPDVVSAFSCMYSAENTIQSNHYHLLTSPFSQGQNSIFSLRLDDFSDVFDVEPKLVTGSSQVSIRVANATLDFENPNQRKFIVLIIAEETKTKEKLSSTATLTVTVTDTNDNRPVFEQEPYSFSVSETAPSGTSIASIIAKDQDSGAFGTNGIRYSLSGSGSELFAVDEISGVVSVADCPHNVDLSHHDNGLYTEARDRPGTLNYSRDKRQTASEELYDMNGKNVNLTIVSQSGLIDINVDDDDIDATTISSSGESYYTFTSSDEQKLRERNRYTYGMDEEVPTTKPPTGDHYDNDYLLFTAESDEDYGLSGNNGHGDYSKGIEQSVRKLGPGKAPCLDFETQSVYFLSYKATDDNGHGLTSVTSLRITLIDANDSPPVCESSSYRASLDEGATFFDPPLIVKARDLDVVSDIGYRCVCCAYFLVFEHIINFLFFQCVESWQKASFRIYLLSTVVRDN